MFDLGAERALRHAVSAPVRMRFGKVLLAWRPVLIGASNGPTFTQRFGREPTKSIARHADSQEAIFAGRSMFMVVNDHC